MFLYCEKLFYRKLGKAFRGQRFRCVSALCTGWVLRLAGDKVKFFKHACVVLLFVIFCVTPEAAVAVATGTPAPDFKLKTLQGHEVSLSDFKGRLVLLKLATTWCPTCRLLSAEIDKVGTLLRARDVVVIEVFVQDSAAMVEKYLGDKQLPMAYYALLDDGQAYEAYSVYLIPRLLVIDAGQIVRFESAGRNVMADDIAAMVEEFSRPAASAGPS